MQLIPQDAVVVIIIIVIEVVGVNLNPELFGRGEAKTIFLRDCLKWERNGSNGDHQNGEMWFRFQRSIASTIVSTRIGS